MPMFMDTPSGERPRKPRRTIGLWMAAALVVGSGVWLWWRGRETAQDAIPEASAQAQVEAARARENAMA